MHSPSSPTDPALDFALATERMRTAFEDIAFNPEMFHVTGSVSDHDLAALSAPVEGLAPDLLARFVRKLGTTWGGPDDLRRVAARVLTLAADQQLPLDRGLVWTKLGWADWQNWPTYQATTTREFLRCEWRRLLSAAPRPAHVAHRWLSDAAHGLDDLGPFLEDWTEAFDPTVALARRRATTGHLVLLLCNSPLRPDFPETIEALFPANPAAAAQVRSWLTSAGTTEVLTRAATELADTSDARRVQVALDRQQRLTRRLDVGPLVEAGGPNPR